MEGYHFGSALYFLRSALHDHAVLVSLLGKAVPMDPTDPATAATAGAHDELGASFGELGAPTAITLALMVLILCAAITLGLRVLDSRGRAAAVKKAR